jgi:hypothetical protein
MHTHHSISFWIWTGLAIFVGIIVAICIYRSRKERKWNHDYFLTQIRNNSIACIVAHTHGDPTSSFKWIKSMAREYRFSEKELEISFHDLLGHTVTCQRNVIAVYEQNIAQIMDNLDQLRYSDPRQKIEDWEREIRKPLIELDSQREALKKARADYKEIDERWTKESKQSQQKASKSVYLGPPQISDRDNEWNKVAVKLAAEKL